VTIDQVGGDHRGLGEYGPLRQVTHSQGPGKLGVPADVPTVTVRAGDPWPGRPELIASQDVEVFHVGMPTRGLRLRKTKT